MAIKIYGMTQAVCPQRVMLCLIEKGVAFEIEMVDLGKNEQKQPQYMAKQPFGQVPFIVDGDFELFESRAIIRYYAGKYCDRAPKLLGETPEDRARVDQWLDVEAINFNPVVFPIVLNNFILPRQGAAGNPAEAAASAEKLAAVLDVYEKQLSKTKFLAGDGFTLADLTHIPNMRAVIDNCGMGQLLEERQHVKAWWGEISRRPASKRVMEIVVSGALHYSP